MIKTSSIGDVIQAFPVLEYLRRKFPDARIDWVVEEGIAPLLKAHPMLDRIIGIHTKAWRKAPFSKETRTEFSLFVKNLRSISYDLAIDLQGNTKSAVVTAGARAKIKLGFGWRSVREKSNLFATNKHLNVPKNLNIRLKYLSLIQGHFNDTQEFKAEGVRLQITQAEQERLKAICNALDFAHFRTQHPGGEAFLRIKIAPEGLPILDSGYENGQSRDKGPKLMVCFGSRWANKRLDPSMLTALLQKIAREYAFSFLFIFGDEKEKQIADDLANSFGPRAAAIGNLSLPLWQALMWEVNGIIAVDSAALHLCGTTQTPSFSIFGPSLASSYKPIEERHLAVQGACPYGRTFASQCPILRTCPTGNCLHQLKTEDLFASFKHWADLFCFPRNIGL
jgi:heptosyltransferase-1